MERIEYPRVISSTGGVQWKPDDPIKRILCREFRPRIIVPRAAARVPARAAGGDNGVELKMLDAWKRCLLLFYGGGIPGRREGRRKGGGEGDLSLNRFAHRMHSRFLEQRTISQGSIYAAWNRRGGRGVALPTPTRLRIFLFPVNTFAFYLSFPLLLHR